MSDDPYDMRANSVFKLREELALALTERDNALQKAASYRDELNVCTNEKNSLRAEIERLRELFKEQAKEHRAALRALAAEKALTNACERVNRRNDELLDEVRTMRAALKPFATVASHGDYGGPLVQARIYYECETEERAGKMYIDSAAFRAAAAALKESLHED